MHTKASSLRLVLKSLSLDELKIFSIFHWY